MSKLESLREALAVSPANVPLLMLYAQACIDELSFDEARRAYEQVLAREPERGEAKLGIAQLLQLTGHISEAIVRTEALVQTDPKLAEGWLLLSRLALADGDRPSAPEHYQKALQLRPALKDSALEKLVGLSGRPIPTASAASTENEQWHEEDDDDEFSTERLTDEVSRPAISFADVGGMEEVKEEIRMKIIYPLQNRDLFRAYGKKIGGGVLLYGPPGCGKTLISQATAGEIRSHFISVAPPPNLDLYIGNSEKNLHQLFQSARDNAPAVLFFDEVDALAADRKDFRESAMRTVINQFLAEMDGNVGGNEGILILGATNAPWHLDPAFRRPGRFDRVLFVPPPDSAARAAVLRILIKGKPTGDVDFETVAKKADGFSGADIKAIIDLAVENKLREAMKEGLPKPLATKDLLN